MAVLTILIPDWLLFAVLFLIAWRIARWIWRLTERLAAALRWRKDRIDYYDMAKHRIRFEEATDGAAGPARTDPRSTALPGE